MKVKSSNIALGELVGEGAFGTVNLGFLTTEACPEPKRVAVKRIASRAQEVDEETFLYEAYLLAMLDHPHIIKMLAIQYEVRPMMIVTGKAGKIAAPLSPTPWPPITYGPGLVKT